MKIKNVKFSISTSIVNSEVCESFEFEFPDEMDDGEIEDQIYEMYQEWVNEKNYGTCLIS